MFIIIIKKKTQKHFSFFKKIFIFFKILKSFL